MTATGPPAPQLQTSRAEIRRRRVRLIRKRTIVGSMAAFAAAWTIMFSQLVSGHDPALGNNTKASGPAAAASSSTSWGSSTSPGDASSSPSTPYSSDNQYSNDGSNSAGSSSGSSSAPLAPMTTQQS